MLKSASELFDHVNEGVKSLRPYEPGKPIDELEREYGVSDVVKLASNENPLGPGKLALKAATEAIKDIAHYPDGNGFALKKALAAKHNITPGNITLGNGSNDVLELIARVFLRPGVNAVFSEHAFAVYPIATQAVGAEAHVAKACSSDHPESPYGHDLSNIKKQIDEHTRVVLIANPNNPTGTWLKSDELKAFVQEVPQDVITVLDEAYFEYVEEEEYPDTIRWIDEFQNLVVTRTFSKAYGLAGLRIGYSISSPLVSDLLNRVRQPFNVNSIAQAAALAALEDDDHIQKSVKLNKLGMSQLIDTFDQMGLGYIPSVGNFICVNVGKAGLDVYEDLLREGVIVRPITNYGLPEYLRITVGSEIENQRFIDALKKVLQV